MALNTHNERHLYVKKVASGWRIERPSGWEIARCLETYEEAEKLLLEAGYKQAADNNRYQFNRSGI